MALRRWFALCGAAAPVVLVVGFAIGGSTPDDKASAEEVISFYRDHKNANYLAAFIVLLSAVLVVFFAARLSDVLRGERPDDRMLPISAFGGGIALASALGLAVGVHIALVEAADHRFAAAAQTLNVLDSYDFIMVNGAMAILLLAAGIATVRKPVLARWLGWVAIILGVACLAGPVGFLASALGGIWIVVVGIILATPRYLSTPTAPTTPTVAA